MVSGVKLKLKLPESGPVLRLQTTMSDNGLVFFKVIAVHTGANNIHRDGADEVLEKYEDLCGKILQANPICHILLSAILPRAQSGFDTNRRSEDFLNKFNNVANEVNQTLSRATQSMDRIQFIEFPQYIVSGEIQRHLLSKDGLHLSIGTR